MKTEKYQLIYRQVRSLLEGETDQIANMANISALLHSEFGFWWTGFYRVCGEELVLGPFQGPVACTRIPFGKGVCGSSWQRAETIVVPDVEEFPRPDSKDISQRRTSVAFNPYISPFIRQIMQFVGF